MEEEKYVRRCIEPARDGLYSVAPNPMVGAVIAYDGLITGEGYHIRYGEAHVEVSAIRSIKDRSLLGRSTIYVNLEPCSYYGRAPPCADLIIEKQIPRVVIGYQDPFSRVAGQGIQKLRSVGRKVTVGVLEKGRRYLIRRFITFNTLHHPFIILKWTESADHFINIERTDGNPIVLSSLLTSIFVHKKGAETDAIMIGRRTASLDSPLLTVRNRYDRNPVHIVLDRALSPPHSLHLFDGGVPTIVFTVEKHLDKKNVTYRTIGFTQDILPQIIKTLYQQKIQFLLIEGGSQLLQSFTDAELWDEVYIEKCPCKLNSDVKAPETGNNFSYSTEEHFDRQIWHYVFEKQLKQFHLRGSTSIEAVLLSIILYKTPL